VTAKRDYARHSRQLILPEIGTEGQSTLLNSSVSIVGCGATGSTILNLFARVGVGALTIVDRDSIELTNLQRQIFFDEGDLEQPKALVAAAKVRRAKSDVVIHDVVKDLNPKNAESILGHSDLIIDGSDNMETRFLVNDVCAKHEIPWVYCGEWERTVWQCQSCPTSHLALGVSSPTFRLKEFCKRVIWLEC
jgi:molybdopterin/thiamine biosynthesis adenylyltransferase